MAVRAQLSPKICVRSFSPWSEREAPSSEESGCPAPANMPQASRPARQLWSMKAEKLFGLQRLPDEEHTPARQAVWKAYVKDRTEAEAGQKWLSGRIVKNVIPHGISTVLAAAPNLTEEDRAMLQASAVVIETDTSHGDKMHSTTYTTRLYSFASPAAVDVQLSDFALRRYSTNSVEYATSVSYALVDAAKHLHNAQGEGSWQCLFVVSNNQDDSRLDPDDMEWMDYPEPELHLTLEMLVEIRQHLFSGAAAAISGRLSDCELVRLLVVSSGSQWCDYRGDGKIYTVYDETPWESRGTTISRDGWLEHHVREMCNELRPEVAQWKPEDTEKKVLDHIMRWAKEKRSPVVRDQIKKRIDEGRFTKEAFKKDGAPEGYFDTVPSDGEY